MAKRRATGRTFSIDGATCAYHNEMLDVEHLPIYDVVTLLLHTDQRRTLQGCSAFTESQEPQISQQTEDQNKEWLYPCFRGRRRSDRHKATTFLSPGFRIGSFLGAGECDRHSGSCPLDVGRIGPSLAVHRAWHQVWHRWVCAPGAKPNLRRILGATDPAGTDADGIAANAECGMELLNRACTYVDSAPSTSSSQMETRTRSTHTAVTRRVALIRVPITVRVPPTRAQQNMRRKRLADAPSRGPLQR